MTQPVPIQRKQALVAHPIPLLVEALATLLESVGYHVTRGAGAADARNTFDLAVVAFDAGEIELLRARRRAGAPTVVLCDDVATAPLRSVVDVADGVLVSTAPVATVRACLDTVGAGGHWLDPAVAKLLHERSARPATPALTRRERDVAELVAAGQRNRGIADTLGISEGTVKMHLHNVYAKLGLESRTQLAMNVRAQAA